MNNIYLHDKKLASLCQNMQIVGIGVDIPRKDELSRILGERAEELLGEMRSLVGADFSPSKTAQLRAILYDSLGVPVKKSTRTGLAATDKAVLEALAQTDTEAGKLCKLLTEWRYCSKLKSTFLDGLNIGEDGRIHASWKSFGTVSGRLACRNPNLMNIPAARRWKQYDPRSIYVASPGHKFVYFDVGQAEMRFAAYLSGDKKFIEEVESGDVYTARALTLFKDNPKIVEALRTDPKGRGKGIRRFSKTSSLAANYLIEPENLYPKLRAEGAEVRLRDVVKVLGAIHDNYRTYFQYVYSNVEKVAKCGYIEDDILGRRRWLGFSPEAAKVANQPIQGGIAAVMNNRLIDLSNSLGPIDKIVAQIHDAAIIECLEEDVESVRELVKEVWAPLITLSNGNSFVLPIDLKDGDRMSQF